jgi:hypothetical protein
MTAENKKAVMLPLASEKSVDATGLKTVKNAVIFQENGLVFIRHYKTVIFAHNPKTGDTEILMNCSNTSNRQIKNALDFFNVPSDKIATLENPEKFGYSESRN